MAPEFYFSPQGPDDDLQAWVYDQFPRNAHEAPSKFRGAHEWWEGENILINGLLSYDRNVRRSLTEKMRRTARDIEAWGKVNAPWTDRTGNARSGLQAYVIVDRRGNRELVASHGPNIYYGFFLEFKHGGKNAIIGPMIERGQQILDEFVTARYVDWQSEERRRFFTPGGLERFGNLNVKLGGGGVEVGQRKKPGWLKGGYYSFPRKYTPPKDFR